MNALRVQEGLELVLRIQSEKKADAFFEYSGHVDGITIRVHPGGWSDKSKYIRYTTIGGCERQIWSGMMMLDMTEYDSIADLLAAVKEDGLNGGLLESMENEMPADTTGRADGR